MQQIQVWDFFECGCTATATVSNPFTDVKFGAVVRWDGGSREVDGFYDGGGVYRFRCMPQEEGVHRYRTHSNLPELDGIEGEFTAVAPASHGPVRACGTRFRYADGAPAFIMGTTAYAWHYRPEEVRAQTLDSFSAYGFNKIRMLVFPKQYSGGFNKVDISYEPPCYPFEGVPKAFDFRRPNPQYFRDLEQRVRDLLLRGIQADVILFHPYDSGHWDIDAGMDEDDALLYLKYIIARLAAYRNVWWSLANEYDVDTVRHIIGPHRRHWDAIGAFIKAHDPYGHLISCHSITFGTIYPDREWLTHVSYQHPDTYTLMGELMARYNKPVIDDEYQYEGNMPDDWGNSTPQLVVERHWRSLMAGGYATHGEAFIRNGNNKDIFWSYGGTITGESARRLQFLKQIADECPLDEMRRDFINSDGCNHFSLSKGTDFYLIFCRHDMPGKWPFLGPYDVDRGNIRYKATTYDAWNCKKLQEKEISCDQRLEYRAFMVYQLERIR